jgi:hypothetical protein
MPVPVKPVSAASLLKLVLARTRQWGGSRFLSVTLLGDAIQDEKVQVAADCYRSCLL